MLLSRDDLPLRWNKAAPAPADTALAFCDELVLLRDDDTFPTLDQASRALPGATFLRAFAQGERVYCAAFAGEPTEAPGYLWRSVRMFREMADSDAAIALITAYHLARWEGEHRFCGACGQPTRPAKAERALVCPECNKVFYPAISPAVTVAITDGDRILLAQNALGVFRKYSLIAGYVEVGESLEQTVRREVMEEVGLRLRNIRYIASQPWGLTQTQMVGFHAELDGPDAITLQRSELSDARWFRRDELEARTNPESLSFEIIERFRRGTL